MNGASRSVLRFGNRRSCWSVVAARIDKPCRMAQRRSVDPEYANGISNILHSVKVLNRFPHRPELELLSFCCLFLISKISWNMATNHGSVNGESSSYVLFDPRAMSVQPNKGPFSLELYVIRGQDTSEQVMSFVIRKRPDASIRIIEVELRVVFLRHSASEPHETSQGPGTLSSHGFELDPSSLECAIFDQPHDGTMVSKNTKTQRRTYCCLWIEHTNVEYVKIGGSSHSFNKTSDGLLDFRWSAEPRNPVDQCPHGIAIDAAFQFEPPKHCDVVFRYHFRGLC